MTSSPGLPAVIDWIVSRGDGTYRRGNWAGKGPLPSIKGVTADVAHLRHPDQHTIAEIVLHMAYWKDAVTARLTGQPWKYDESQNWRAAVATEQGWAQARAELGAAHRRLMAALRTYSRATVRTCQGTVEADRSRGRRRHPRYLPCRPDLRPATAQGDARD